MPENLRYGGLLLDPSDNVATLLFDCDPGGTVSLKGSDRSVLAAEPVRSGHKIAVSAIATGSDIIKYGQRIGRATVGIQPGEWVHLHNMESIFDTEFKKRVKL